jgi:hypothetical protein
MDPRKRFGFSVKLPAGDDDKLFIRSKGAVSDQPELAEIRRQFRFRNPLHCNLLRKTAN